MAVATRIDSIIAPPLTQQSLYDGIKKGYQNTGFTTPYDEFTSGTDKAFVYEYVQDSTKTYGKTYLKVRVLANLSIGQQIFTAWSPTTRTGSNGSTEFFYSGIITSQQANFTSLNGGDEYGFIILTQTATNFVLGCFSPAFKPSWWNLNAWSYGFIPTSNTFASVRGTALSPFTSTEHDFVVANARLGTANPATSRRDILPGILMFTQSNQGVTGRTSDEMVQVAASGSTRYDVLQIPADTKEYLILSPTSGGLAVRTK